MNITIAGVAGRMGQMLAKAVLAHPDANLFGATLCQDDPNCNLDVASLIGGKETGIIMNDNPLKTIPGSDVVIDFTTPDASLDHTRICANSQIAYVCGTTGFSEAQSRELDMCQHHIPFLRSANFSLGVNLLLNLVEKAANALPDDYDIEVLEMHHNQKIDAPSGTALALGKACAKGKGKNHDEIMAPPYFESQQKREAGKIGYAVLRGGTVIGEHQVIFAGTDERIIFDHRAQSKELFAKGAVHGALWLCQQKAGLYSMQDVLDLSNL